MGVLHNIINWKQTLNQSIRKTNKCLTLDDEDLKKLQDCILKLYLDIYNVCENNNIDLFLTGGAAIGALRHKGFIPWDDDIDCGIRRRDYKRFIRVIKKELGDKYIINAPNISPKPTQRFTKIMIPGTKYREIGAKPNGNNQMIGIDVFIIENVPDNSLIRLCKGTYCNALEFISGQVSLFENRGKEQNDFYSGNLKLPYTIKLIIGGFFSFRKSFRWFETLDKAAQHNNEQSKYCSIVTGRKHYFGEIAPRYVYFPASYATFCDHQLKVFNDEDEYLRIMYGDYMELPPVEKREMHFLMELEFKD